MMLRNYLLVTLRNIEKQKGYTITNVLGLSIALAVSIFIFMYVKDELTFDTGHPNSGNLYRIGTKITNEEGEVNFQNWAMAGWDNYLKDNYEKVVSATSYRTNAFPFSLLYESTDKIQLTNDMDLLFVEPNYSEIIYTPIIAGDANSPLKEPNTMIISHSAGVKVFNWSLHAFLYRMKLLIYFETPKFFLFSVKKYILPLQHPVYHYFTKFHFILYNIFFINPDILFKEIPFL